MRYCCPNVWAVDLHGLMCHMLQLKCNPAADTGMQNVLMGEGRTHCHLLVHPCPCQVMTVLHHLPPITSSMTIHGHAQYFFRAPKASLSQSHPEPLCHMLQRRLEPWQVIGPAGSHPSLPCISGMAAWGTRALLLVGRHEQSMHGQARLLMRT